MRRALFATVVLLTGTLGVAVGAPLGAGAQDDTTVYVANGYTYAAGHGYPRKFCVDGTEIAIPDIEEIEGPFSIPSGSHTVVMVDEGSSCADTPDASTTADFPAGGNVTIFGYWPRGYAEVAVLVNDVSCVEDGQGRLSVANGAAIYFSGPDSIDVDGTPPGGSPTTLMADIASGAQGATDLDEGTVTGLGVFQAGFSNQVEIVNGALSGTSLDVDANELLLTYVFGGNDGDIGSFSTTLELESCQVPTTTTTTTTTAPPAPAAAPAQLQPTFTG